MRVQYDAEMKVYEQEQELKNIDRRGMSKEQRERHEALDAARANAELSGSTIGEEQWQQSLRWANGEITMDEYCRWGRNSVAGCLQLRSSFNPFLGSLGCACVVGSRYAW